MSEYENQVSKPTEPQTPVPFENTLVNSTQDVLDDQEIEHFKTYGFIVKKGLIADDSAFEKIIDYVWATVPKGVMSRQDPQSWTANPHERWPEGAHQEIGVLSRSSWKMRSHDRIGYEPLLCDATARHPAVRAVVTQFIGEDLIPCQRVRGVYVILPKPIHVKGRLGPHVDHAANQLSAMVIAAPIRPRGGGFTVWPGSHVRLHRYWLGCQHAHFNPEFKDQFDAEFNAILQDTVPVEFCGEPGDVVFWHPRLIHSAGVNYSAETPNPQIRYAIPCDFQKDAGRTFYDDDELGPGPKQQWWVDTRHFREDPTPTSSNLWTDWEI